MANDAAAGSEAEANPKSAKPDPVAEAPGKIVGAVKMLYMTNEKHRYHNSIPETTLNRFCTPKLDLTQDAKSFIQAIDDFTKKMESHAIPNAQHLHTTLRATMGIQLDNWTVGNVERKEWDSGFGKVEQQLNQAKEALVAEDKSSGNNAKAEEIKAIDKLVTDLKDIQKKEYESALLHAARVLDIQARAKHQQYNEQLYFAYMKNGTLTRLDGDPNENAEEAGSHATVSYGKYKPYDKGFWSDGKNSIFIDEDGIKPTPPARMGSKQWTAGYTLALRTAFLKGSDSDPIRLNYSRPEDVRFEELERLLKIAFSIGAKVDLHRSKCLAQGLAAMTVNNPSEWFRIRKFSSPQEYFLKMIEKNNALLDERIKQRQMYSEQAIMKDQEEQKTASIKQQAEEVTKQLSEPRTTPEELEQLKDKVDNWVQAVPKGAQSAKPTMDALQDTVTAMGKYGRDVLGGAVSGLDNWCIAESEKIKTKLQEINAGLLSSTVTVGPEIPQSGAAAAAPPAAAVMMEPDYDDMELDASLSDQPHPSAPPAPESEIEMAAASAPPLDEDESSPLLAALGSAPFEDKADSSSDLNPGSADLEDIELQDMRYTVNLSGLSESAEAEVRELNHKIFVAHNEIADLHIEEKYYTLDPISAEKQNVSVAMNVLDTIGRPSEVQVRVVESIVAKAKQALENNGVHNDPEVVSASHKLDEMRSRMSIRPS